MPGQHIHLYDIYDVNVGTKPHNVTHQNVIHTVMYDRRTQTNIVCHLVADSRNDFLTTLGPAR